MRALSRTVCPACKKYIGLWLRDGIQIASEQHFCRRVERVKSIERYPSCGVILRTVVYNELVCNRIGE